MPLEIADDDVVFACAECLYADDWKEMVLCGCDIGRDMKRFRFVLCHECYYSGASLRVITAMLRGDAE